MSRQPFSAPSSEAERRVIPAIPAVLANSTSSSGTAAEAATETLGRSLALGESLKQRHATVATAESCTGGLVSGLLTDAPGASAYFVGGIVSYSNAIKEKLLGVKTETLIAHGAVSRACVEEMACGVRDRLGATFGVAVSGIAGPTGGTPDKPVGTVHLAVASPSQVIAEKFVFPGDREAIRRASVIAALALLERAVATLEPRS